MLAAIRNQTKSWVVKIFLGVIALSFAVWGIGDIFRGNTDKTIANVGSSSITVSEFDYHVRRMLRVLQQQGITDIEQMRALGLFDDTLDAVITERVFDLETANLGMGLPDQVVADAIRSYEGFADPFGQFDARLFQSYLRQQGLSEERYVAQLRGEILRRQLLAAVTGGVSEPELLGNALYAHSQERRLADYVVVSEGAVAPVPEPSREQAMAYHAANQARFTAPETRRATYAAIGPGDLFEEIQISDEESREEYAYRLDELTRPEERDFDQMVFSDAEAAAAARARVVAGEDFFAVAAETTGATAADAAMGLTSEHAMLPELAAAILPLAEGTLSAPIESGFGWYVVRINQVVAGGTPSFEEAREQIEGELKLDQAIDAIFEISDRFQDELAGGATLEAAAAAMGLTVETAGPTDRFGTAPDGVTAAEVPPISGFLDTAFALGAGQTSQLVEAPGNTIYVVRVDETTPPATRPFDDVASEVASAWQANYRTNKAREQAQAVSEAAKVSGGLAAAATVAGLELASTAAITRTGAGLEVDLGDGFAAAVFGLASDGVTDPLTGPDGFVVAQLTEIQAAASDDAQRDLLDQQLRRGLQGDVMAAFQQSLRQDFGVSVDRALLNQQR